MSTLQRKSILGKTLQFGGMTFLSRILGLVREVLQARYLGVGVVSDAFIVALKLPLSLRKIFAEGALSSAFVPVFVDLLDKNKKKEANSLMTLSFLFFEGILALFCLFVFLKPHWIIKFVVPGFSDQQMFYASRYLKILVSFILFVSSSALLTVALNSVNHFLVPASGPVLVNIFFIVSFIAGIKRGLSIDFLCYSVLTSGFVMFLTHLFAFFYYNFSFGKITSQVFPYFKKLLIKFGPVFVAMSIVEINLLLDTAFSSYLSAGTVSIMTYAFRFMHIPLGVFGVAFSTILLPHFSKVAAYAPKRISYYLLESIKFIFWISLPVTVLMSFFSKQIFSSTILMSGKFPIERLWEAQLLLIIFVFGLFFFSLTKILQNAFYALNNTVVPMISSIVSTFINFVLNFIFMKIWGVYGLAAATVISTIVQSVFLLFMLKKSYKMNFYFDNFLDFCKKYTLQFLLFFTIFLSIYAVFVKLIYQFNSNVSYALMNKVYFWFWISPIIVVFAYLLFRLKKHFGIKIYFLP